MVTEETPRGIRGETSGSQIEQLTDELILLANSVAAEPACLPLRIKCRNHTDRFNFEEAFARTPSRVRALRSPVGTALD